MKKRFQDLHWNSGKVISGRLLEISKLKFVWILLEWKLFIESYYLMIFFRVL